MNSTDDTDDEETVVAKVDTVTEARIATLDKPIFVSPEQLEATIRERYQTRIARVVLFVAFRFNGIPCTVHLVNPIDPYWRETTREVIERALIDIRRALCDAGWPAFEIHARRTWWGLGHYVITMRAYYAIC